MTKLKGECRTITYCAIVLIIMFGSDVNAAATSANGNLVFDGAMIFRVLLSALMGILIWVARGADARITALESSAKTLELSRQEKDARIKTLEDLRQVADMDSKNQQAQLNLLRELVLTKYPDRVETEKHREYVERILREQQDTLRTMCIRMDNMARPLHRRSDDLDDDGANGRR